MRAGWPAPIVRATRSDGARRQFRAWSISKVLTAVALLRRLGWSDRRGTPLRGEVSAAMDRALVRSENCPQRRMVLELQELSGRTPDSARAAIAEVLQKAGATDAEVSRQAQPPEPLCAGYMQRADGISDPNAPALLAGTSTWTIGDAARLANALTTGAYGRAISRRVLGALRRPKQRSEEATPIDFTAAVNWGAGAVFGALPVAYKSGWGGTQ
jgi:hypothetical protein